LYNDPNFAPDWNPVNFAPKERVAATNEPLAGRGDSGMQRWSDSKFLVIVSLVLFWLCLATRIPFRSSFLSGYDPVEFALAIRHLDIIHHRPHPPGYILYIGMAKLLSWVINDATLALTTMAALFSALSTVLIFLLAFYMYGRRAALLASAMWVTCPLVWFHGLVGEMYAAAGFGSLATALSVFLFLRSPSRKTAAWAGGAYGLAAALRPDQLLLLAPLFLFPFWRSSLCRRWALFAFCPALALYAAWYIPTLVSVGGYRNYAQLVGTQFSQTVGRGSVFFGAPPVAHLWMVTLLISGLLLGLLPFLVILPILWAVGRPPVRASWSGRNEVLLLAVWAGPFLLFYSLIFISKVGYCIACLPPILLALSRWVVARVVGPDQRGAEKFWSLVSLSVVVSASVFLFVPRLPEPMAAQRPYRLSQSFREAANLSILSCEYDQIRFDQSVKGRYLAQLRKLLLGHNSALVAVQSMPRECLNSLFLDYYFSFVPVYAVTGLGAAVPGVHYPLKAGLIDPSVQPGWYPAGKGSERNPTLAVAKDRVLLLHLRNLHISVNERNGSAREFATEGRDDRSDIYQVFVLQLTPTSSVDITSNGQTLSIVE
jgi:4-amino-4-deoxy-L-arabinose transferase-like glycosyltransferase